MKNTSVISRLFSIASISSVQLAPKNDATEISFTGDVAMLAINDETHAKISLTHTNRTFIHEPDALLIAIENKKSGPVSAETFAFKSYLKDELDERRLPNASYAINGSLRHNTSESIPLFVDMSPTPQSVSLLIDDIRQYIQFYV